MRVALHEPLSCGAGSVGSRRVKLIRLQKAVCRESCRILKERDEVWRQQLEASFEIQLTGLGIVDHFRHRADDVVAHRFFFGHQRVGRDRLCVRRNRTAGHVAGQAKQTLGIERIVRIDHIVQPAHGVVGQMTEVLVLHVEILQYLVVATRVHRLLLEAEVVLGHAPAMVVLVKLIPVQIPVAAVAELLEVLEALVHAFTDDHHRLGMHVVPPAPQVFDEIHAALGIKPLVVDGVYAAFDVRRPDDHGGDRVFLADHLRDLCGQSRMNDSASVKGVDLDVAHILSRILLHVVDVLAVIVDEREALIDNILDVLLRDGHHVIRHHDHLGHPPFEVVAAGEKKATVGVPLGQHRLIHVDVHTDTLLDFISQIDVDKAYDSATGHARRPFAEHEAVSVDGDAVEHEMPHGVRIVGHTAAIHEHDVRIVLPFVAGDAPHHPEQSRVGLLDVILPFFLFGKVDVVFPVDHITQFEAAHDI